MLLGLWPSTACTPLPQCCSSMCGNACAHTQMHSLTMCFTGLSPTSFCRKLTLPFSLCHPARPLSSHLAYPLLPRPVTRQHLSLCHSPLCFLSLLLSLLPLFSAFSPFLCLFVHNFFCIFLSFCGLPLATPYWAGGQCGSEAGCNYFTPPLTAIVKGE